MTAGEPMNTRMFAALMAMLGVCEVQAQAVQAPSPETAPQAIAAIPALPHVADGAVVEIELAEPVSSRLGKRGDKFALRLHAPVLLDGAVLLPAGTPGVGEIVHADRARGGGKPGELILAARYLELDGVHLPLRGMKLGLTGKDNSDKTMAAAVAIGVFAQFIHGGEIEIPAGTIARAKLLGDFTPADVVPAPAAESAARMPPSSIASPPGTALPLEPIVSTVAPQQE
jgi:hypothetical protein